MGVAAAASACLTVSPKVTRSSPTVDTDELEPSVGCACVVVVVPAPASLVDVAESATVVVTVVDTSVGAAHSVGIVVVGGVVVGGVVMTNAGTVVDETGTVVVDAVELFESPPRVIMNSAALMTMMRAMRTLASCRNGTQRS